MKSSVRDEYQGSPLSDEEMNVSIMTCEYFRQNVIDGMLRNIRVAYLRPVKEVYRRGGDLRPSCEK